MRKAGATFLAMTVLVLAGCFDEPTPARETVPEGARVYLNDKGLKDLKAESAQFKSELVDYVNLDRNKLAVFPEELTKLTGLKWLRLNDNQLKALPDLKGLTNLRRLYLKNNRFTQVPETIKDLPQLTDLEMSGNPITEVPAWLAQKKGLKNLSFNRTRLTKLPEDLTAWQSLQSLQMGDLNIPAGEMARIRKALPKVALIF